tara:strand:- start:517 stop:1023 length:507 start_codon:yes stop_codon:yes gene_type:complete
MFKEYFDRSNVVDIIEEMSSDDAMSHKVVFRVKNAKAWAKILLGVLRTQEEDPDFGLSVQKQYFLSEESTPSFLWVILMWGDMEDAIHELGPLFQKKAGPPRPPNGISVVNRATTLKRRTVTTSDGRTRTETQIPLPHARGNRDIDPNKIKKLGTKGMGATVLTGVKE